MTKSKIQNKSQIQMTKSKAGSFAIWHLCFVLILCFVLCHLDLTFAQDSSIEFNLDVASETVPLSGIFKPNIDLSGRGSSLDNTWPQSLAAKEVLYTWQNDIGFEGIYRLQYNLWEISQLVKDKESWDKLRDNYEKAIKNISDSGGVVILDLFGTPAGMGKVLDKKSFPQDMKAFKTLVKKTIRELSCDKRYNIWYEVWTAPDLEDFFLGRKQEYLNLYRLVAEAVTELKAETKIYIPLGGPGVSWWFQNFESNNITTAERSLIYELIKFCYKYKLPLNFITWHSYSTDPKVDKEDTNYNKIPVKLIRDWLSYFSFNRDIPLIIDEWNYDRNANVLPERRESANISASYIPIRLKNMYQAGLDYQLYFSLEDFQNNKEAVVRNTGIFWFDSDSPEYKGEAKSIYNVFRMLKQLGEDMFVSELNDEFMGVIAAKGKDYVTLLIYNYIDPDIATNYLSRNIAKLKGAEKKSLLSLVKSDKLTNIVTGQTDIAGLHFGNKMKAMLKKAKELNDQAVKFKSLIRSIDIKIKNLKGNYSYQRYVVDSSCAKECKFVPAEDKEMEIIGLHQEKLSLEPYSVQMIIFKAKPKLPEIQNAGIEVKK